MPLTIRPLATHDEYRAAVELQYEAWGRGLADATASTILKVAQKVGGVSAGAFDEAGQLAGFVFGLTGVRDGRLVHWSHMLAVRDGAQNRGVGQLLKEYQRQAVARLGVHVIYWTYDPLVARNAHLNFNTLGVRVSEYARDMYGDMGSDLNRGIGTDRFVVAWPVDDAELDGLRASIQAADADPAFAAAPVINPVLGAGIQQSAAASGAPRLRVRIPSDIGAVQATDLETAAQWRADTRAAIEHLMAAGYRVVGFVGRREAEFAHYLFGP